ncbi:MAG TPA: hypothetical protein VHK69_11995 [Chitinophagaceae bacterium]|jgi:hypothetical protein|nr:hypothetical protein [Chitinophagaceae bacterium]
MLRMILPALVSCWAATAVAQEITATGPTARWQMVGTHPRGLTYQTGIQTLREEVLYWSESEALFPVRLPKNEQGILKLKSDGTEAWTSVVPGAILGFCRLDASVLVVYTDDDLRNANNPMRNVKLLQLDPATGKELRNHTLSFPDARRTVINLLKDPAGAFRGLAVYINPNGNNASGPGQGGRFEVYRFSPALEVTKETSIPLSGSAFYFPWMEQTADGSYYLLSATDSDLIMERYTPGGSGAPARLSLPHRARNKEGLGVMCAAHPTKPMLLVSVSHKNPSREMIVLQYDWQHGAVAGAQETVDAGYGNRLRSTAILSDDKKPELGRWELSATAVKALLFYGDRPVVIKESVGYTTAPIGRSYINYSGSTVITLYEPGLTGGRHFLFNRWHEGIPGRGVSQGIHLSGNRLRLIGNDGSASYGYLFGQLNLEKGEWEVARLVQEGGRPEKSGAPIEPGATLWFPSVFLLHQMSSMSGHVTRLHLVRYP